MTREDVMRIGTVLAAAIIIFAVLFLNLYDMYSRGVFEGAELLFHQAPTSGEIVNPETGMTLTQSFVLLDGVLSVHSQVAAMCALDASIALGGALLGEGYPMDRETAARCVDYYLSLKCSAVFQPDSAELNICLGAFMPAPQEKDKS